MLTLEREDEEIDDVLNKCAESSDKGSSKWPAMTYEQGVEAALLWVTGQHDENPMEDE